MSLCSRAYKVLSSRYRSLIGLERARARAEALGLRARQPSWSNLEPLEPRVLLSGTVSDPALTDFILYGQGATVIEKDVTVTEGLVGSGGDIEIEKSSLGGGIRAVGDLNLAKDALVDGNIVVNGDVQIDKDAWIGGDIDAGGNIAIAKDSDIIGAITATGSVDLDGDVTVTGPVVEFGSPQSFLDVALPGLSVIVTDPSNDLATDKNTEVTLAPGQYGDLELDKDNVLNLSTGEYHFDLITIEKNLQLNLDASGGEIAIFVTGDVSLEKDLDVVLTGGDAADVYLETHGAFSLDKNSDWIGTIYAPMDDISFGKDTILIGAAYSSTLIHFGKNSSLTLAPSSRLTGISDTDPPLITVGLANDTGASSGDTITSDPAIGGIVLDDSEITSFLLTVAGAGSGVSGGPFDVTEQIDPLTGSFSFDRTALETLLVQTLQDDDYTISLQAEDEFGNVSSIDVTFTLDTAAPADVSLANPSDGLLTNTNITVNGQIPDPSEVSLLEAQVDTNPFFSVGFDAAGQFNFNTILALDGSEDGTHTIRVRTIDTAGNQSTSVERSIDLDTIVAAPVISNFDQDTGVSSMDGITSDTQLVLFGVAESDSMVTVSEAGLGVVGTAAVDSTGQWVVDVGGTVLVDGTHVFTAVAVDPAGNTSVPSNPLTVQVDGAAPVVVINNPTPGLLTNTNVTVDGLVADAVGVSELETQIDGGGYSAVSFDAAGDYSFDTSFALDGSDDGTHTIELRATDLAGNVSTLTQVSIQLDTQVAIPLIEIDDAVTGNPLANGDFTAATTLILRGTGDVGSTVTLSEAAQGVIGTAVVDAGGSWVIDPAGTSFTEGTLNFNATAADPAGNLSGTSSPFILVIDATPPDISLDIAPMGVITNTNLTITGQAQDPSNVFLLEVQIDTDPFFAIGFGTGSGSFSFNTTFAIDGSQDGIHTVRVRATDSAGNVSDPVEAAFELDTVIVPPVIDNIAQDTGVSLNDRITSDTTLILSGTAEANSQVTVSEASLGMIGTVIANGAGHWNLDATATVLPESTLSLTAIAVDQVGNVSAGSVPLAVVIDVTAPVITIDAPAVGLLTSQNVVVSGVITESVSLDNAEAQIDGGAFFALTVELDGSYSFNTSFVLDGTEDGVHTIAVRATDTAGNLSGLSQVSFVLDTQVASPVITGFSQDTGVSANDGITNDTMLVFTGTAEAGSQVTVSDFGLGVIGATTADGLGDWTLDATALTLPEGVLNLTAVAVDATGNVSVPSVPLTVQIDVTAPNLLVDSPTSGLVTNQNVTVSGQVSDLVSLETVEVQIDGGLFIAATVQPGGSYNFDTSLALDGSDDGTHSVTVRATDTSGNVSQITRGFDLDTVVSAPVITEFDQDTGTSNSDNLTSDTRLIFSGTADPNSTITISDASAVTLGAAQADASGVWTVDATGAILPDGVHVLTAVAQDQAGNISNSSVPLVITVDTVAPTTTILSPAPGITVNSNVLVTGDVNDPNGVALLEVSIDSGPFVPVILGPFGGFDFLTTLPVDGSADGLHTVDLRATDDAGNISGLIQTNFVLSSVLNSPVIETVAQDTGASSNDRITSDNTLNFSGTAAAGSIVTLSENVLGTIGSVTADVSGQWNIDASSTSLPDGNYTFTAIAQLGLAVSDPSADFTVVVDTAPPTINNFELAPQSDTGNSGDFETYLPLVTLIGSTSPNAEVQLVEPGLVTTADASGQFQFSGVSLNIGDNNFTAAVTDIAGNQSQQALTVHRIQIPNSLVLQEVDQLVVESTQLIVLGQDQGSRTLRFDIEANFDTTGTGSVLEDMLLVYLVDPVDPTQTLLDRSQSGTALFALVGDRAEFRPGLVQYDGHTVTVDLTGLGDQTEGRLVFQLVNSDADTNSSILISELNNTVDVTGQASLVMPVVDDRRATGGALDLSVLTGSTSVITELSNVRIDAASGRYIAELRVRNNSAQAIDRNVAVVFPGLPVGVTLLNPSGVDANGDPYISMRDAILAGGLDSHALSAAVQITFDDPTLARFPVAPVALINATPNQAPTFNPVGPLSVNAGDVLRVNLVATDPEGENVTLMLSADTPMPTTRLDGSELVFTPSPGQVGQYTFTLIASDGMSQTTQSVTIDVLADLVTTTRISGQILDVDDTALAGVPISLGVDSAVTDIDGRFTLILSAGNTEEVLKIQGDQAAIPGKVYPFIAETLPLLFGHDLFASVNNVIERPIYLPVLDIANADTVDATQDTLVDTAAIPGASVFIEAGTLRQQDGTPFNGLVSITEVPINRTPAALPENLRVDLVVTIQPGDMVFTTPAPITLPNRAGYAPGTLMQIWSIDPIAGDFAIAGTGQVSEDGSVIETISGGIRNSSWHVAAPPPDVVLGPDGRTPQPGVHVCPPLGDLTSAVDLHSGVLLESHDLVSYQSLGIVRGLSLRYDSLRAYAEPIVHVQATVRPRTNARYLAASLSWSRGTTSFLAPQHTATTSSGNELKGHFWQPTAGTHTVALKTNLSSVSTGIFDFSTRAGLFSDTNDTWTGQWQSAGGGGQIAHVNSINSAFGAGWGISGLKQVMEEQSGSVLVVDGDGSEQIFAPDGSGGYTPPEGSFDSLEKLGDGTFRITSVDQTVLQFNARGDLASVTDRNSNSTQYVYNASGQLTKIVDPAGLETTFTYTGSRITSITDPANRVTTLQYDAAGNLTRITDPDTTSRQFEYNTRHLLTSEIDKRGNTEQTFYDFSGRVTHAIQKDGRRIDVTNVQTEGLRPSNQTAPAPNPADQPQPTRRQPLAAFLTDRIGRVQQTDFDDEGQDVATSDDLGQRNEVTRDPDTNLVTQQTDSIGFRTQFEYDAKGNLTVVRDAFSGGNQATATFSEPGEQHVYTFTLSRSTFLVFDAMTNNNDFVWTLRGPSGLVVNARAFTSSDANSRTDVALDLAKGDYELTIDANGATTGDYDLRLLDLSQASNIALGTLLNSTLNPGNSTVMFNFEAEAGQRYFFDHLSVSGSSFNRPNWRLIDPVGKDVFRFTSTTDREEVLSLTGTYTLLMEGQVSDTTPQRDLNFAVHRVVDESILLTLGRTIQGNIAHPGQQDVYTFSLANHTLTTFDSLTNRNDINWKLVGPNGTVVNTRLFSTSDSTDRSNAILSLETGDYTLTVDGGGDATGDYSFRLLDLSQATPVTPGTPVSDTVTPGNGTTMFQFAANAGDPMFFDFQSVSGFITQAYWRLVDPIGNDVFLATIHNGASQEIDLPVDGTYTLLIEGWRFDSSPAGVFTFNVQPISDITAPLTLNTTIEETIEHTGQKRHYSFTLASDKQLAFDALTGNSQFRWTLTGPRGTVVDARSLSQSDHNSAVELNLVAGDYTLTMDGLTNKIGLFGFKLLDLSLATPLTPGVPVIDAPVTPSNSTVAYQFTATAGDPFFFDTIGFSGFSAQNFTRPIRRLVDPFGKDLFTEDMAFDGQFMVPFDGTYTLLIEGVFHDPNPSGLVSFNVQPIVDDTAALTLGSTVNAAIDHAGQSDHYTFSLASDTLIAFDTLTINGNGFSWSLTGPWGEVINNRTFITSDAFDRSNAAISLDAGDYTLTVTGTGSQTGAYSFRVHDLALGTPLTPGTPVINDTITPANGSASYQFDALAGDAFYLDFQSVAGFSSSSYWRLVDPFGNEEFLSSFNTDRQFTAAFDGTYSLLIEGRYFDGGVSGQVSFNVHRIQNDTAALILDTPTNGSIDQPGQQDHYTFTVGSDTLAILDVLTNNTSLRWSLQGPFGEDIAPRSFTQTDSGNRSNTTVNLIAGDYTLTIEGNGDFTGSYDFQLLDLNGVGVTPIIPGTAINGSLLPANTTAVHQLDAFAGDRFDFDFQSSSGFSTTPYWRLVDPFGRDVFLDRFNTDRSHVVPFDGTYHLLIEGLVSDTAAQGDFQFNVVFVTNEGAPTLPNGTPISLGDQVSGSISVGGEQDVFNFTVATDTDMAFDTRSIAGSLVWSLEGPRGTVVNSRILTRSDWREVDDPIVSLVPGDYALTVFGFNSASTGSYTFSLLDLATANTIDPTVAGLPVSDSISPASGTAAYAFTATGGSRYYFDHQARSGFSTSSILQPYWRLVDPHGIDVFLATLVTDQEVILDHDGTYYLLIEGSYADTNPTGQFTFDVNLITNDSTVLSLSTPTSGVIDHPGQQDRYTFTLASDTLVAFDSLTNRGEFNWQLDGPRGPAFTSFRSFVSSDSENRDNAVLNLVAGDYTLTINGFNDAIGNYDFQLLDLASASTFTPGTPIIDSVTPANSTAMYQFTANAGDEYYFDAIDQSGFSTGFNQNPSWRLVDPIGRDVFNQRLTSDGQHILEFSGTYTLLIEGRVTDSAALGQFTVNAQPITKTTSAILPGVMVVDSLDHAGQERQYTVTLTNDTFGYLDVLSSTNISGIHWSLDGPRGRVVNQIPLSSADAEFPDRVYNLPAGDYTLTLDAFGDRIGDYTFVFRDVIADATAITPGVAFSNTVVPVTTTAIHTFDVSTAGQRYYFDILAISGYASGPNFKLPSWRLVDPFGKELFNRLLFRTTTEQEELTLELPGTYMLLVEGDSNDTNPSGSYTINVQPITDETSSLTVGQTVSSDLAHAGQKDRYTFTLANDSSIVLDALAHTGVLQWSLTGPQGAVVTDRPLSQSDHSALNTEAVMKLVAGDYTLSIDGIGDDFGAYGFRLLDLAVAPVPITPGLATTAAFTANNLTESFSFNASVNERFYIDFQNQSGFTSTPYWRLIDPVGIQVFDQFASSDSELVLSLDGVYTLILEGRYTDTGTTGQITFAIVPIADTTTPLVLDSTTSGRIEHAGQQDRYTFTLAGDEFVLFDSLTSNNNLIWTLDGPQSTVASNSFSSSDGTSFAGVSHHLEAGDYILTVDGQSDTIADYAFRLLQLSNSGSIVLGQLTNDTLTPSNSAALYQFDAEANQRFYFQSGSSSGFSTTPTWRLLDPFGQFVFRTNFTLDVNPTLTHSGTYTLVVEGTVSDTAATADVGFSVHEVVDQDLALTLNAVTTGAITTPGQANRHTFQGRIGQRVYFDGLSQLLEPLDIQLIAPDSNPLMTLTSSRSDSNVVVLTHDGSYTLEIDATSDTLGNYRFRLLDLDATQRIALDTVKTGQLSTGNRTQAYRFDGTQGQTIDFQLLSGGTTDALWKLVAADGRQLINAFFNGSFSSTLPSDGEYFLLIDGNDTATTPVNFQIQISDISAPFVTPSGLNTVLSGSIAAGQVDIHTFDANAGTFIDFELLTFNTSALTAELRDPNGQFVASVNTFSTLQPRVLTQSGQYTLEIEGRFASSTGSYAVRVVDIVTDASPITFGTSSSDTLDPGATATFAFNASVGQRLLYDGLDAFDSDNITAKLFNPATNEVFSITDESDRGPFIVTLDGTYLLRFENNQSGTVDYDFRVLDVSAATTISVDTQINDSFGSAFETKIYQFVGGVGQHVLFSGDGTNLGTNNGGWSIYGPNNQLVARSTDSATNRFGLNQVDFDLTESGVYTVVIDSHRTTALSYSFTVSVTEPTNIVGLNPSASGAGRRMTYDPVFNQLTSVIDDLDRQTLFDLDPITGNILSTTRVVGQLDATSGETDDIVTTNMYTTFGLIDTITDPLGRIVDFDYDPFGRLITGTFAIGTPDQIVERYEYDAAGNRTAIVDGAGNRTEFEYDNLNRVTLIRDALLNQEIFEYDNSGNKIKFTDKRNHPSTFDYDVLDRRVRVIDPIGNETQFIYNAEGNVIAAVDANSNETRFVYDSRDRLIRTIAADGGVTQTRYDDNGNVVETIDPNGNRTQLSYDARDRLTSQVDALGQVVRLRYDAANNPIESVDELGRIVQTTYDELDRETKTRIITSGLPDVITSFTYDKSSRVVTAIDPLGRVTQNVYDRLDRLTEVTVASGTLDAATTRFEYDAAGNQTAIIDANSHRTEFVYDTLNRNTIIRDANLKETLSAYDELGNLISFTDRRGNTTEFEYDELNRLVLTRDALLNEFTTVYDAIGNVIKTTDPLLRETTLVYDNVNRLLETIAPTGDKTVSTYDLAGNQLTATDANNNTTSFEYDALNRVVITRDAESNESQLVYDATGNIVEQIDALGRVTRLEYDGLNRVIREAWITASAPDAAGELERVTNFTYDLVGNQLSVTDSLGNVTSFVYDNLDRLITETDPLNQATSFVYDEVGNITEQTDREGRITRFVYDNLDRVETETQVDALGAGNDFVVSFSYDDEGNLLSVNDPDSTLAYTYDAINRLETEANTGTMPFIGVAAPDVILAYTYDDVGNLTTITEAIDGQAGAVTAFTYDDRDRIETQTQTTAAGSPLAVTDKRVDFAYDGRNQFTSIDRYTDLTALPGSLLLGSTYTYDNRNRLTDLRHTNATAVDVAFYTLIYDTEDRLTQLTDIDGSIDYTYNGSSQLTGADYTDISRTDETYEFDVNGNRISSHTHNEDYQTSTGNRLLSDGTFNYDYDDRGNLLFRTEITTGSTREFVWDHGNRLIRVTDKDNGGIATQRVNYAYDTLDRRIAKAIDVDGDGAGGETVTHFVYFGDDVLLEFTDPDGSGITVPTISARYLHGPATDQVLAREDYSGGVSQGVLWHLSDNLGTVRDLANHAGTVVNHIKYDAFGNVINQSGPLQTTRYLFTGRELDTETSLYYYRARYYDPAIGRFISEDPIGFEGGFTNLFSYVGNSPTFLTDPTGLQAASSSDQVRSGDVDDPMLTNAIEELRNQLAEFKTQRQLEDLTSRIEHIKPIPGAGDLIKATRIVTSAEHLTDAEKIAMINGFVHRTSIAATSQLSEEMYRKAQWRMVLYLQGTAVELITLSLANSAAPSFRRPTIPGSAIPTPSVPTGSVTTKGLTQAEEAAARRINNILNKNFKLGNKGDVAGAVSDMVGNPIPKVGGGTFDHVTDLNNMLRGLRNNADKLRTATDPASVAARQRALETIQQIEDSIRGSGL